MTGYSYKEAFIEGHRFSIEIKTLNNRFMDMKIWLQRRYSQLEPLIAEEIKKHVRRGRVEANFKIDEIESEGIHFEAQLTKAKKYVDYLKQLKSTYKLAGDITL